MFYGSEGLHGGAVGSIHASYLQGPWFDPENCLCGISVSVLPVSMWGFSGFSDFLPLPDPPVHDTIAARCECVCAWCPGLNWCPIHNVFQTHVQCSWDRRWIYHDPDQDKCLLKATDVSASDMQIDPNHHVIYWNIMDHYSR